MTASAVTDRPARARTVASARLTGSGRVLDVLQGRLRAEEERLVGRPDARALVRLGAVHAVRVLPPGHLPPGCEVRLVRAPARPPEQRALRLPLADVVGPEEPVAVHRNGPSLGVLEDLV